MISRKHIFQATRLNHFYFGRQAKMVILEDVTNLALDLELKQISQKTEILRRLTFQVSS
jgi:hypothetical protein